LLTQVDANVVPLVEERLPRYLMTSLVSGDRPDPVTIPEVLRMLRSTIVLPPRRDHADRQHWSHGGAATSTKPARPTGAGMPTQMPHCDYNELELPYH